MKPLHIGIVTQAYYPVLGGVTEHVFALSKELEKRGHRVTVIAGTARDPDDRGLRVLRIGFQIPIMSNGARVSLTAGYRLGRVLRDIEMREQFDVVHIQSPLDPFLPLAALRSMERPKIGTHHTTRDTNLLCELFPNYFHRLLCRLSANIAVSHSAEGLVKQYYPDLPLHVIPNGVDTERFSPRVAPFPKLRDGIPTILFVGRIDPRKGARFLFAALPYLEKKLSQYRVVVVGTGWMRKVYDKFIPLHLQHRVQFTGVATCDELPRYYRSADVFCSPALGGESQGIVLLEALASGIPIVASDIEGYRWVLQPGVHGILVPPKSPRHIADALIQVLSDPARHEAMAGACRTHALQYAWPKMVDQIEPLYDAASKEDTVRKERREAKEGKSVYA